jgi:hypothetical protein
MSEKHKHQWAPLHSLSSQMQVGDMLFVRLKARPFLEAADAMMSWCNHVSIVVDTSGPEPLVAESVIPMARVVPLSKILSRTHNGRMAWARLAQPLTPEQQASVTAAARKRHGAMYDFGFNFKSERQFCSKFVREVLHEATGHHLGVVETMEALLSRNPKARLQYWRIWFLGRIPWERETLTPISMLRSEHVQTLFDGRVLVPGQVETRKRGGPSSELGPISTFPAS